MNIINNPRVLNSVAIFSGIVSILTFFGSAFDYIKSSNFSGIPLYLSLPLGLICIICIGIIIYLKAESLVYEDLIAEYTITILNTDGDAKFNRMVKCTINQNSVFTRTHKTYTDGAITSLAEFALQAWDKDGGRLNTEIIMDKPNMKHYLVHFPSTLSEGDQFEYTDEYRWKGVFNVTSDYWILRDTSKAVILNFLIDKNWHLKSINAFELGPDTVEQNRKLTIKGRTMDEIHTKYSYKFEKGQKRNRVVVRWTLDLKK